MTMLQYVLLSLLAREPRTGYDLTVLLRGPLRGLWQAGHSQIYPELTRLEQARLIAHRRVPQAERPDKKLYTITAAGLDELAAWMAVPPNEQPARDELTVKAFCVWLVDREVGLRLFREREQHVAHQIAEYTARRVDVERYWNDDGQQTDSPWFGTMAILQRGLAMLDSQRTWCQWMIAHLERSRAGEASGREHDRREAGDRASRA